MDNFIHVFNEQKSIILLMEREINNIIRIADNIVKHIEDGGKLYWIGNGGSAVDCQHFSAELVGSHKKESAPIASLTLTSDTAIITALANDIDYRCIFERQIIALCNCKDVMIALTTSGKSKNVLSALKTAKNRNIYTVVITGASGKERVKEYADDVVSIPSDSTPRIQEAYYMVCHALCEYIETEINRRIKKCILLQEEPVLLEVT